MLVSNNVLHAVSDHEVVYMIGVLGDVGDSYMRKQPTLLWWW